MNVQPPPAIIDLRQDVVDNPTRKSCSHCIVSPPPLPEANLAHSHMHLKWKPVSSCNGCMAHLLQSDTNNLQRGVNSHMVEQQLARACIDYLKKLFRSCIHVHTYTRIPPYGIAS